MKIALSGRIFETEKGVEIGIEEFVRIASDIGYDGVELRHSQIGNLTLEEIKRVRKILDEYKMDVSFITCLEEGEKYFEEFKKVVEKAVILKTGLVRIIVEDIGLIKKSCQFLIENKIPIKIFEQIHTGTIFEKFEDAINICKEVNHSNFGLSVEPGNFVLSNQDYSKEILKKLLPYMINVQFQNIRKAKENEKGEIIEYKGEKFIRCLPDDLDGIDFSRFIKDLKEIGYKGWVNIIEPKQNGIDSVKLAQMYYKKFKKEGGEI
ncbi:MAG: sugar phosphate isomerase/epimerase [Candidatus Omnitrophica bacterium]|nr:sugar phosphate isomerase/epimerase [Candidatus Omnitrophota bacterium]